MNTKINSLKYIFLAIVVSLLLISPALAGYTVQDLTMNTSYSYTANFIDTLGNSISKVTIVDNTGFSTTTESGTFTNIYGYGLVTFKFTSQGYNTLNRSILIDRTIVENVTLTTTTGGTSQTMYVTPHKVRFMCRDYAGTPIVDMGVTAVGVQSTLGSVDWVASLFGIDLGATPITTTLMSGTTGSDGSVVFILLETEKYQLKYTKASQGINETRYYYPKQEEFDEIFWTEIPPQSYSVIQYVLYNLTANSTFMNLGLDYTDTVSTTDRLIFYIQDNSSNEIYSHIYYSPGSQLNVSHAVPMNPDETYYWGFSANSTQYSNPINGTHFITFNQKRWLIDPMGAGNPGADATLVATAALAYNWAAVGLVMMFALIFGRFSIKIGVVIVPLIGALFKYIGWLDIAWLLVSLALALGIILAFRYSEEEAST